MQPRGDVAKLLGPKLVAPGTRTQAVKRNRAVGHASEDARKGSSRDGLHYARPEFLESSFEGCLPAHPDDSHRWATCLLAGIIFMGCALSSWRRNCCSYSVPSFSLFACHRASSFIRHPSAPLDGATYPCVGGRHFFAHGYIFLLCIPSSSQGKFEIQKLAGGDEEKEGVSLFSLVTSFVFTSL